MLCELKIQFERHMNEGKYHLAEPLITAICALNKTEGLFRYACSEAISEHLTPAHAGGAETSCLLTGKLWF